MYAGACAEQPAPCDAQTKSMTVLYSYATSALLFGGLPAGTFADTFGAIPTCLLAGLAMSSGHYAETQTRWAGLGLAWGWLGLDVLVGPAC